MTGSELIRYSNLVALGSLTSHALLRYHAKPFSGEALFFHVFAEAAGGSMVGKLNRYF